MTHSVNIVVAMKSEASPLIDQFGLERMTCKGDRFPIFGKEQLKLVVSGIGANRAKEAVRYLAQISDSGDVIAWLNVGVAGHGVYAVGTGFLANCIVDSLTQRTFYPLFTTDFVLPTGKVITVDVVETEYKQHAGYDMEAFGFAASASRFSTFEMIHCFKVVSDNRDNSVQHLTRMEIQKLVAGHVDSIDLLCCQLRDLTKSVAQRIEPEDPTVAFANHWRMTVAQREILRKYLHKTKLLNKEINVDSDIVRNSPNASTMLNSVQSYLNQHWQIV